MADADAAPLSLDDAMRLAQTAAAQQQQPQPGGLPAGFDPSGGYFPPPDPNQQLSDAAEAAARAALLQGADARSGAPTDVRATVSVAAPQDRLAALQKYYPDAQVLPGTDNFVYTDPSGKRMTYEPTGWRGYMPSAGNIAGAGSEIAEGVGAVGGGLAGSAVGGPGVGTAVGAGLGATAAKEGYRRAITSLLAPDGGVDTRTGPQVVSDVGVTAALNAVMPWLGERVGGPIVASLLRGDPTATATAAQSLEQSGLAPGLTTKLPGGVIGESPGVQRTEQIVGSFPITGGVRQTYQAADTALDEAAQAAAARAGQGQPVPNPSTFAENVNTIAQNIDQRFQAQRGQLDDTATNLIGADRLVDLQPLRDLRTQLVGQMGQAPQSMAPRYQGAISRLDQILADAASRGQTIPGSPTPGAGALPYSVVQGLRTDIGKEINWGTTNLSAPAPTGVPALQQLYGALKDSLTGAADQAGPLARSALDAHDSFVSAYRATGGPAETFEQLADPANRANVITRLSQSTAPQDQAQLAQLMSPQFATAADRGTIRAGVLQQIGTKADGSFDMPTWLRNYSNMPQAQKDILFGYKGAQGSLQGDLDNLATVQKGMQSAASYRNFPNTAPTLAVLNALGTIGTGVATGDLGAAALTAAGTFGSPWVAGKALTSRPFVKWMSGNYAIDPANAGQWAARLAQLGTVAQLDPTMADVVSRLQKQLPAQLPAQ